MVIQLINGMDMGLAVRIIMMFLNDMQDLFWISSCDYLILYYDVFRHLILAPS